MDVLLSCVMIAHVTWKEYTMQIKMLNGMVRELKEVRYVPQFKKNLISVGALKTLSHEITIRDGVLKMTKGSMVVLKGVRRNNLYYLKGSTVTSKVAIHMMILLGCGI